MTYFEATGARGLLNGDLVFPVYHVLALLGRLGGGELLDVVPSSPLEIGGLAVATRPSSVWVGVANLTDTTMRAKVGPVAGDALAVTIVDEFTFPSGCAPRRIRIRGGSIELEVGPYGVAFLSDEVQTRAGIRPTAHR
jgi:hypothetical protein